MEELENLYKELGTLKWIGADEGWELAIDAVRKHIRARCNAIKDNISIRCHNCNKSIKTSDIRCKHCGMKIKLDCVYSGVKGQ